MKTKLILLATLMSGTVLANGKPDTIGGSPKANFHTNELTIPCVMIEGLDDDTEGLFFDIKLKRRGKSFNYELIAAQAEDTAMCQAIADFAMLEDEDLVDDDDSADDDSTDDDSADDDSTDDDSADDGASDDAADDSTA